MTDQGLQPAAPADLRASLISLVAAIVPDYTANLPGSLIEDISSTDTFALVESDSFLVDLVNSVTPYGANAFLLNQLGILYGVDHQPITNTAVYVVFNGPPGYVVAQGFVVSDGTYQYVCQTGGICGVDGNTLPIYALATVTGAWEVLSNTVVQMLTSVPASVPLTVTNPVDGIPSLSGEPISIFRERCFTAGLAASTGMARYLKTLCGNVPGVQNRLIAVQIESSEYVVIVGGGDPYQVAYAIWQSDFYIPGLTGASILIDGMTNTNPIQVTTTNNHNLLTGDVITITGVNGMYLINGQQAMVQRLPNTDPNKDKEFTIYQPHFDTTVVPQVPIFDLPIDGTPWGAYTDGGQITPNPINTYVTVSDFPDTYVIPFVIPPQERVAIVVIWDTDSPNFVAPDAIAQAAIPEIVNYINSLPAGTTPINLNVLNKVFLDAVAQILVGEYIIDLQWTISINEIGRTPGAGTQVIFGDPYSYFYTENGKVQVLKGTF
jgi:hypothetical protein